MASEVVNVRYMVSDAEAAIAWYTNHPGFDILSNQAPPSLTSRGVRCGSCSADR